MQLIITGRHCDVDADVKDAFGKRMEHLQRFEPRVSRAEVTVTRVKRGYEVEAEVSVDRAERVHARSEDGDMRTALDLVVGRLAKQLRRQHARHHEHQAPPTEELFGPPEGMGGADLAEESA